MRAELLQPTRVYRFYRGGALIDRLRGEPEEDGDRPEDWVGSLTPANNPGRDDPEEGLSRLADGRLLRDVVEADSVGWLGEAHVSRFGVSSGLLVKLLDSAERLPVHFHPDRAFAREAFGSAFGKTEAWLVLDTREGEADVWVGLREPVAEATYLEWIAEQDTNRPSSTHSTRSGCSRATSSTTCRPECRTRSAPSPARRRAPGASIGLLPALRVDGSARPSGAEPHPGLGWETAIRALDLGAREAGARSYRPSPARSSAPTTSSSPRAGSRSCSCSRARERFDRVPARPGTALAVPAGAESLEVQGELRVLRCLAPDPHAG